MATPRPRHESQSQLNLRVPQQQGLDKFREMYTKDKETQQPTKFMIVLPTGTGKTFSHSTGTFFLCIEAQKVSRSHYEQDLIDTQMYGDLKQNYSYRSPIGKDLNVPHLNV